MGLFRTKKFIRAVIFLLFFTATLEARSLDEPDLYLSVAPLYAGRLSPKTVFVEPSYYGFFAETLPGYTPEERQLMRLGQILEFQRHRIRAVQFAKFSLELRPFAYLSFGLVFLSGIFEIYDVPTSKFGLGANPNFFVRFVYEPGSDMYRSPMFTALLLRRKAKIELGQLVPEVSLLYPLELFNRDADLYIRFGSNLGALQYYYEPGFRISFYPHLFAFLNFPVRYWKLHSHVFSDISGSGFPKNGYPNLNFSFRMKETAISFGFAFRFSGFPDLKKEKCLPLPLPTF